VLLFLNMSFLRLDKNLIEEAHLVKYD